MVLNIKNLFKKVCILGASATMALGFLSPLANAAPPSQNDQGTLWSYGTARITASSDTKVNVKLTLNTNLTYDGSAKQLISGIYAFATDGNKGFEIWARAVKVGATDSTPYNWQKVVSSDGTITLSNVTGTDVGDYNVYLWFDGNGYFNDNAMVLTNN